MNDLNIRDVEFTNLDVPLRDNFTISQGVLKEVNSILISLLLDNGVVGYGEVTPFTELSGENRQSCMTACKFIKERLVGRPVDRYRIISGELMELLPEHPSVRCGVETAIMDAYCRVLKTPLWKYWGGKKKDNLITDITIPILGKSRSMELAEYWYQQGFRTLKIKVGLDPDKETDLITSIHAKYPEIKYIIDANQGFSVPEALKFYHDLEKAGCPLLLYEQPVHKNDLDGMAEIRNNINIPLAADESVFSKSDLISVIKKHAADVVNLKIMKTGLLDTYDIAVTVNTMGLDLMIGGMIETRLAMGASLALAAGLGTITYLDLDTPLLMTRDPFVGGYQYQGPRLFLSESPGLGIEPGS